MSLPDKSKFDPQYQLVDRDGRPTQWFRDYMRKIDALLDAIEVGKVATLVNIGASGTLAANDAAAQAAGVAVGALYCDANGFIHVRTA